VRSAKNSAPVYRQYAIEITASFLYNSTHNYFEVSVETQQDQIFRDEKKQVLPFQFNEEVAHVFDDMVSRSVPFYHEIHRIILDLIDRKYTEGDLIYDLGCSTGTTIKLIHNHLKEKNILSRYIGIDNSFPMLKKCEEKLSAAGITSAQLFYGDLEDVDFVPSKFIIMNYTLQFIDPQKRIALLKKIYNSLLPGGVFILSEKIVSADEEIDPLLVDLYYDFKKRNGYSQLEISQKREALENVLRPITPEDQMNLLREAGFESKEMIFRWYNFTCYMGLKK